MHSSRMRTGQTLTVSRKIGDTPCPEKLETPPPKNWRPPRNWRDYPPPPEKLETPPSLWTESQTPVKTLPWPKLRFGR